MQLRINDNHYITFVTAKMTHPPNVNVSLTYKFRVDTFKCVLEGPSN